MLDPTTAGSEVTLDVVQGMAEMSYVKFFFIALQLSGVVAFGLIVTFTAPTIMQKIIVGGGSFFGPMLGGALSLGARAAGSAMVMGSGGVASLVGGAGKVAGGVGGAALSTAGSAIGSTLGQKGGAVGAVGRGLGSTMEKAGGFTGAAGKRAGALAGNTAARTSFAAGRTMLNAAQSWSPDNPRSFAQVPDVAWDEKRGVDSENAEKKAAQYLKQSANRGKSGSGKK